MHVSTRFVLVLAFAVNCFCNNAVEPQTESSTVTSSGLVTTGNSTETTAMPTTTAVVTTGTAESSADPKCGDGLLDSRETCDDGNGVNGDGCNTDCSKSATPVWAYQSKIAGRDRFYSVALDKNDAIFVAGVREDGAVDSWVAQFNSQNGEIGWSMRYDHAPLEAIRGIAVSSEVIYVVGGVQPGADDYDIWVAGLDLAGKLMWDDTFSSGFGPDYATAVAVLTDGDAVVAGVLTPESMVGGDLWVRRYAPDGASKWTSTRPDVARPLWSLGPGVSANDERVVIAFAHRISGELQPEMLIAYPLGGGSPLWNVDIPNTQGVAYGGAHTANNELVIASRHNFSEFVVRRVSALGDEVRWESSECMGETGRAVAVDHQGDIVVIGDGNGDVRLCKFSPEGTLRWGKGIDGGQGDDFGYALAITSNDYIVVGGWFSLQDETTDAWLSMYSP